MISVSLLIWLCSHDRFGFNILSCSFISLAVVIVSILVRCLPLTDFRISGASHPIVTQSSCNRISQVVGISFSSLSPCWHTCTQHRQETDKSTHADTSSMCSSKLLCILLCALWWEIHKTDMDLINGGLWEYVNVLDCAVSDSERWSAASFGSVWLKTISKFVRVLTR